MNEACHIMNNNEILNNSQKDFPLFKRGSVKILCQLPFVIPNYSSKYSSTLPSKKIAYCEIV